LPLVSTSFTNLRDPFSWNMPFPTGSALAALIQVSLSGDGSNYIHHSSRTEVSKRFGLRYIGNSHKLNK